MSSSYIGRFRLTINAANAKPSPSIGQALGPLGINMMTFCKEFNNRTKHVRSDVPVQVTILPSADRTYKFWLRTPASFKFLLKSARVPMGSASAAKDIVGNVTLKEIYHIAKAKSMDPPLIGYSLKSICKKLMGTAKSMGILVSRNLEEKFVKKHFVNVQQLESMRKDLRQKSKAAKRGSKS